MGKQLTPTRVGGSVLLNARKIATSFDEQVGEMIRRTQQINAVAASTPPSCKSTPAAGCEPARVSVFTRPYNFTASSACAFAFRKWMEYGGRGAWS